MNNLRREIEFGLKSKCDHLNHHKSELDFYRMYEKHLMYEIDIIRYKLNLFDSEFFERLLRIKIEELKETREAIESELILIDYFQNDIDLYFNLKK